MRLHLLCVALVAFVLAANQAVAGGCSNRGVRPVFVQPRSQVRFVSQRSRFRVVNQRSRFRFVQQEPRVVFIRQPGFSGFRGSVFGY